MEYFANGIYSIAVESIDSIPNVNHPLGLRRVSDSLGEELFPGLSVYTKRAKYFSLLTYWHNMGWLSNHQNRVKMDAILSFLNKNDGFNSAGLVGKDVMKPVINQDEVNPSVLPSISMPSFNQYKSSLRSCNLLLHTYEPNTDDNEVTTLINQVSVGMVTRKKIDDYITKDRKLNLNLFSYLKKWKLDSFTETEITLLRNKLGIGSTHLLDSKGRDRSISLLCIENYYKKYGKAPNLQQIIRFSKKPKFKKQFNNYCGKILKTGQNPFVQIEVYDLFLLAMDLAFNALLAESMTATGLDLNDFKTSKNKHRKIGFIENKQIYLQSAIKLKNSRDGRRKLFQHSVKCIQYLICEYPDVWDSINRLLRAKSLYLKNNEVNIADFLLDQHFRYTKERSISGWLIRGDNKNYYWNPENASLDPWETLLKLNTNNAFRYYYRLGSINQLYEDLA